MKRCKHPLRNRTTRRLVEESDVARWPDGFEISRCWQCGAWLSLGPSNDSPEAVQIEIRAAEMAVGIGALALLEACGWSAATWPAPSDPRDEDDRFSWHAGWLAREIVEGGR